MIFDFISKMSYYPQKIKNCIEDQIGDSLSTVFLDLVSGICNHNCIFCDGSYNPLPKKMFSAMRLYEIAYELKELKVDSVIIVGEGGESTLHPNFCSFVRLLLDFGIHVGLYTNGEMLKGEIAKTVADFDFVRISLDAGSAKMHQIIHHSNQAYAFDKIIRQSKAFSKIKKGILGASFIVLDKNVDEIPLAIQLCEENGFDYFELKPFYGPNYNFNLSSYKKLSGKIKHHYEQAISSNWRLSILLNNQFKEWAETGFSQKNLTQLEIPTKCYANKLRMVVSPTGCYICTCFRNIDEYSIGDPNTQSLKNIWYSDRHLELTRRTCKLKCTYFAQNEYLKEMIDCKKQLPEVDKKLKQRFFL